MTDSSSTSTDLAALDTLTGGAFTVTTSGERSARLRDWLISGPSLSQLQAVFDEMSHRDKGAAKVLREKLDELRRSKDQEALILEWTAKGEALRDAPRIHLGDAMGWQRDAAKAGAPLSREPLASLKTALAERVKAIEDLQHQTQVQREAAVLLAQRIEVLSTKPWQDAWPSAKPCKSIWTVGWHKPKRCPPMRNGLVWMPSLRPPCKPAPNKCKRCGRPLVKRWL